MNCIYCGGKTQIINSRGQKKLNQTWRRHKCTDCQGVFTSVEAIYLPTSLLFQRGPRLTEPFQRDILFTSVYESCKHRKDTTKAATALTATILSKLLNEVQNASLERQQVISVTKEVLKHFDKAAAVQYQAYHPL